MEGKYAESIWKGIKQMSVMDMVSITRKQANKQEHEQKMVSARNKCKFGSNVHNFIV